MKALHYVESRAKEACGFSIFQSPIPVSEILYTEYNTVRPDTPIGEIAALMAQHKISFVLVKQDQEIVGLITETDLLKRADSLRNTLFTQKAQDILSCPLYTIGSDVSVWEASRIMEEKKITKLPVTENGRICGVITRTGVLRVLCSYGIWKEVREIMTEKVISLDGSVSVEQAANTMYESELSCVVVTEAGRTSGIFTERDYIKRILALHRDPAKVELREVMSTPLLAVSTDCSLFTANRIMSRNKVRRLVVQEKDHLFGIITQTDMFLTINEKIREEEKEYIRQLESSPNGILITDSTWRTSHVNSALLQMLEIKNPSDVLGQIFLPERFWYHPEDQSKVLEELRKNALGSREITLRMNSGKKLYVTLFTTFFRSYSDQKAGCQCFFKDITAQKELVALREAQEQLREAKEKAEEMARKAEEANISKSAFLASMSHEIRTPMNAILGFGDLLSEESLSGDQRKYVKIIRSSAKGLLSLINDILDISKIEAGKMVIDYAETSLVSLLEYLDSMMRPMAIQKGLAFEVIRCKQLPVVIRTDVVRLRQCLLNLLNNAVKFTKQGHVYLNVSSLQKDGQPFIQFAVEDTGIGISAEQIETIFDPYIQANHPIVRSQPGTGLGLSITRKLALLMGGGLSVSSQPGKGSVFTLCIPGPRLLADPVDSIQETRKTETDYTGTALSGKILIVEDNPSNQMLFSLILKKLGLEVAIAEEGQEGLEKIREGAFDLVLMDMQMPRMNGYEASRQIRKEGYEMPIIAVTADAMKGDEEKCLAAGCSGYLSKPVDKGKLIEVLQRYLSAKKTRTPQ